MHRFKWLLIAPIAAIAAVSGGTWAYIEYIHGDAPDRFAFGETAVPAGDGGTTTTTSAGAETTGVEGMWVITSGSQAGYRVKEVLFGQDTEAVGRTTDVDGQLVIAGTAVTGAQVTVDLTTVTSDESRRDNQFRGRIMNVTAYPTATFELTEPIELGDLTADGEEADVPATGELSVHGTAGTVTAELTARRLGSTIEVIGSIPVVFDDFGIPNPSNAAVSTEDHGEIEFRLVFARR